MVIDVGRNPPPHVRLFIIIIIISSSRNKIIIIIIYLYWLLLDNEITLLFLSVMLSCACISSCLHMYCSTKW